MTPTNSDADVAAGRKQTQYPTVMRVVGTNTIPHHGAVETAADGEAAGRHSYPLVGNKDH